MLCCQYLNNLKKNVKIARYNKIICRGILRKYCVVAVYTVCNRHGLSVGAVVMPARYVPGGAG